MYFTNQLFNWFFRTAQQDHVHQINYLKKENQVYRKLFGKKRIILDQEDIQLLVRQAGGLSRAAFLDGGNKKHNRRGYLFPDSQEEWSKNFVSIRLKRAKFNFLHPPILVFYPIFCKDRSSA